MNAELIAALRCESVINDEHPRCESCKYGVVVCHGREDVYGCDSRRIENDAADALEAAERRIADRSLENKMLKNAIDADKGVMLDRIRFLEAQLPKEGSWKKILQNGDGTSDYECSACLGIITNVPDDDEHPLCSFCPNCGAKMDGKENDDA